MEKEYSQSIFISANESNPEGELAVNILVSDIIVIATAHANKLGIGNLDMKDLNAGWVLSRLTFEMSRYPKVNTSYKIITWVEDWNRHFSVRAFEMQDEEGNTIGYARSIWMVLNTITHENYGLSHIDFNRDLISNRPCPISRQAKHLDIYEMNTDPKTIPSSALKATAPDKIYSFQYNDIDFYRHVNTVRYITLLLNSYSIDEFDRQFLSRLELSFMHEGNFGDTISIRRVDHDIDPNSDSQESVFSSYSLYSHSKKKPILFARLKLTPR